MFKIKLINYQKPEYQSQDIFHITKHNKHVSISVFSTNKKMTSQSNSCLGKHKESHTRHFSPSLNRCVAFLFITQKEITIKTPSCCPPPNSSLTPHKDHKLHFFVTTTLLIFMLQIPVSFATFDSYTLNHRNNKQTQEQIPGFYLLLFVYF